MGSTRPQLMTNPWATPGISRGHVDVMMPSLFWPQMDVQPSTGKDQTLSMSLHAVILTKKPHGGDDADRCLAKMREGGQKRYGVGVQIYRLHSTFNQDIGDFF